MIILVFFVAHWYLSLFTQSFFCHRYGAHRMFTMTKGWERFFYIISFIFQGSSFLSPKAYSIMHREHHAFADTDKDPHSPKFSKNVFDMMYKTWLQFRAIVQDKANVDPKFTKNVPNWVFMERLADSWGARIGWMLFYVAFYIAFAPYWWMYLLIPIHVFINPIHGAIINWYAHIYGNTNYKVNDTSKNLLPIDVLMLGESYHNNHHKFGGRPNFGVKWYEFDPVYPFIKLFNSLRIIRLKTNNDLNYM